MGLIAGVEQGVEALRFALRPMSEEDVQAIVEWRYEGPYAFYNWASDPDDLEEFLQTWRETYYAVLDEEEALVGFFTFGTDARVPGGAYDDREAIDIGLGLRPDLTGQGLGLEFVLAGLAFAGSAFHPARFRLTVATFNRRAIRVYERAGFRPKGTFMRHTNGGAHEFVQMTREA